LHIDSEGQLVTQQGDAVLGISGPITFTGAAVDAVSISIAADGMVRVAGNPIGQLRVESPAANGEQGAPHVLQGFLESSNVESVTEMVKLMETIRHFEATQRAARSYDGLLQQAISDLGKI
jgi:flagellar basal-body rod protein FlgF